MFELLSKGQKKISFYQYSDVDCEGGVLAESWDIRLLPCSSWSYVSFYSWEWSNFYSIWSRPFIACENPACFGRSTFPKQLDVFGVLMSSQLLRSMCVGRGRRGDRGEVVYTAERVYTEMWQIFSLPPYSNWPVKFTKQNFKIMVVCVCN